MTDDPVTARVAALHCYPIKACAGIPLHTATLTRAGIAHDRAFMVVEPSGRFRSQRRDPRLALIRPEISDDGARLTLHAPARTPVVIDVRFDGPRVPVSTLGTHLFGIDQGEPAARWLSDMLDAPARLVRVPPDHARVTDGEVAGTSGYADSCAVHLISHRSLAAFNAHLTAAHQPTVDAPRFRANIEVDGWPTPHREDRLRTLAIGDCQLRYAKLATRCVVITVDPRTGEKADTQLLRSLAGYHRTPEGAVFGIKLVVVRTGTLAVGDPLTALAWAP
jgi:uncharacterized protein YcbX